MKQEFKAQIEELESQVASWKETAAQAYRNTDYYKGLVVRCGEAIGADSYVCDDGSIQKDVLCAKVPELVEAKVAELEAEVAFKDKVLAECYASYSDMEMWEPITTEQAIIWAEAKAKEVD